jgi:hypothetical protein
VPELGERAVHVGDLAPGGAAADQRLVGGRNRGEGGVRAIEGRGRGAAELAEELACDELEGAFLLGPVARLMRRSDLQLGIVNESSSAAPAASMSDISWMPTSAKARALARSSGDVWADAVAGTAARARAQSSAGISR